MTNGNESQGRMDRVETNLERVAVRLDRLAEQDEHRFEAFDLGLDRLKERHEALAQTVELMAQMHHTTQEKNERLMAQALEAINALARIAQAHEQRLDGLEGQQ